MKQKKQSETANQTPATTVENIKKALQPSRVKGFFLSLKNDRKKLVWTIVVVVLVITCGSAAYLYKQLYDLKKDPQKVAQAEADALIARVSKLIELPEGERPTIATVTDPAKLQDQPFFARAKKGDKVLIFTNSQKAILYDPVANKIVEAAPIGIGTGPK